MLDQSTPHTLHFRLWIKPLFLLLLVSTAFLHTFNEKTIDQLSVEDKIAQLIMVPVYTDKKKNNVDQVLELLSEYPIGGVVFMQGNIQAQKDAIDRLQAKSQYPLLVGQDNEFGLYLRLKDALRFPRNLTLGALSDPSLVYNYGRAVAKQCQAVGVNVNFAPVVDVNNNPDNPVINDRSFGEDPMKVAQMSLAYMKGLQEGGVMACAKHFPGHGNTSTDSHLSLPVLHQTVEDLEKVEYVPFKHLIDHGLESVMSAHLLFPKMDEMPTSLSSVTIQEQLQQNLHFSGLVFTDSLVMAGAKEVKADESTEVLALKAGNDVLVFPKDPREAITQIKQAVIEGKISENRLNASVAKIIKAKERFGPIENKPEILSEELLLLKAQLFKEAITLLNADEVEPLKEHDRVAFVQIGHDVSLKEALELFNSPVVELPTGKPPLYKALAQKLHIDYYFIPRNCSNELLSQSIEKLKTYPKIVVGLYEVNKWSKRNFGISSSTQSFLESLRQHDLFLCIFGSPYSLKYFENERCILMGYENDEDTQVGCYEILVGARKPSGHLPISASAHFKRGSPN